MLPPPPLLVARLIPRAEFSRHLWPQPLCLDCRFLRACHRMLTAPPVRMVSNFWMVYQDGTCARRHQEEHPPAAVNILRAKEAEAWHEMLSDGDAKLTVDRASTIGIESDRDEDDDGSG